MSTSSSRVPFEAFPFILLGVVDRIDVAERRIGMAGQELRVLVPVSLEGVRVGMRAVITGLREPVSAEATVVGLIPVGPVSPCETTAPPSEGRTLIPLVVTLLMELEAEIDVLDCRFLPINDRHAVRLAIPGELGKEVFLPRHLLERADTDPFVRRSAGYLLSAAVRALRGQRTINDSRVAGYATRLATPGWSSAHRCERCGAGVPHDDPILVEANLPRHLVCPSSG